MEQRSDDSSCGCACNGEVKWRTVLFHDSCSRWYEKCLHLELKVAMSHALKWLSVAKNSLDAFGDAVNREVIKYDIALVSIDSIGCDDEWMVLCFMSMPAFDNEPGICSCEDYVKWMNGFVEEVIGCIDGAMIKLELKSCIG